RLLDCAGADVLAHLLIGQALALELGLVLLLTARIAGSMRSEVLRLDRLQLLLDVLVRDVQPQIRRLLLELTSLDEDLHRGLSNRGVIGRAGLEIALLSSIARARLVEKVVELLLRDRAIADDGDVVRPDRL